MGQRKRDAGRNEIASEQEASNFIDIATKLLKNDVDNMHITMHRITKGILHVKNVQLKVDIWLNALWHIYVLVHLLPPHIEVEVLALSSSSSFFLYCLFDWAKKYTYYYRCHADMLWRIVRTKRIYQIHFHLKYTHNIVVIIWPSIGLLLYDFWLILYLDIFSMGSYYLFFLFAVVVEQLYSLFLSRTMRSVLRFVAISLISIRSSI